MVGSSRRNSARKRAGPKTPSFRPPFAERSIHSFISRITNADHRMAAMALSSEIISRSRTPPEPGGKEEVMWYEADQETARLYMRNRIRHEMLTFLHHRTRLPEGAIQMITAGCERMSPLLVPLSEKNSQFENELSQIKRINDTRTEHIPDLPLDQYSPRVLSAYWYHFIVRRPTAIHKIIDFIKRERTAYRRKKPVEYTIVPEFLVREFPPNEAQQIWRMIRGPLFRLTH